MTLKLHPIVAALLASATLLATPAQAATEQNQASSAILFQGFHWNSANGGLYADLQAKAADLKALGITHVWFPPASDSAAKEGYLPRQLYKLDSNYGSSAALSSATAALNAQGIKSVADVVINHRVGTANWADFTNPTWGCSAVVNNDEWTGRCGNADSGDGYSAARDLDHSQAAVQNDLKYYVGTVLKNAGFSGIRYDYSKGYAASYAGLYHDAMAPNFCVGETWTNLDFNNVDAHRQLLMNYVNGTGGKCGSFDFTTKGLLNQALSYNEYGRLKDGAGKPAGGIGWWSQKMVTFVDNHDTGPSESCSVGQNHWPVPCDKVMQGYAYVLTHPGIPSVYYPHVYNWGLKASIQALISARKAAGVNSTSAVNIKAAQNGLYAAEITGSAYNLAMKIGPNAWDPGAGWTMVTSGSNYAVWKKTETQPTCAVKVTFNIANANTQWGENLYVVGNNSDLGNWAAASAFPMTIQGSGANATWSAQVTQPCSKAVQYKYIKRNPSTGSVVWESNQATASGNREFTTSATNGATQTRNDGSFKF